MTKLLILILCFILSGFNNINDSSFKKSKLYQSIKWPQQEFKMQCSPKGIPAEPLCIFGMSVSLNGLTKGRFEACRLDVENYIKAVKFQNNCFKSDLENYVNSYIEEAKDLLQCEENNVYELQNNRKANKCPNFIEPTPSNILTHDDNKSFGGIKTFFPTLTLCKNIKIYDTADVRQDCINELKAIINYEAQNYFDEQIKLYYEGGNVYKKRDGINNAVNEVIQKFNCVSKGTNYSFC